MRWKFSFASAAVAALMAISATAQTRIVTGRVTDSLSGDPVTSGQVSVAASTIGATLKDDGTFTLAAPTRDVTLSIRSIGFKRKEVVVPASQNSVQVALARDFFQLEAIVVTGQATGIERRNLANAVASVDAAQLVKAPAATVEQSLMGKVASAQIQDLGGGPGGGVLVTLRGTTSLNNAYTPLYVVDGIIVSDAKIPRGTNRLSRADNPNLVASDEEQPINRIGDINPDDIATVEVLKGGSASAIYGSRASNGVILITTKRGRVGAPQFTISQGVGTSRTFRAPGGRVFTSLADAVAAWGPPATAYYSSTIYDHDMEVAGSMPLHYETNATVSGGTDNTRYFASGLVRHEGGTIYNTFADKQSVRLNLDQDVGRRIKFSVATNVVHTSNDRGLTGNDNTGATYWAALTETPSFFDQRPTCSDGQKRLKCDGAAVYPVNPFTTQAANPLQLMAEEKNPESVWRSVLSGRFTVDAINTPRHSLQLIGTGGVDVFNQKDQVISPPDLQYEPLDGLLGTYVLSFAQGTDQNLGLSSVYKLTPGNGFMTATTSAGVQYEDRDQHVSRTLSENLVGGLSSAIAGTSIKADENRQRTKTFGVFGQEEVLIKDRLMVTAGIRADQTSNASDASKLYVYPKAAASYRFPAPKRGLVDEFKLRVAAGEAGNEPNYGLKFSELGIKTIGGTAAYQIASTVAAADIRPERSREIEMGFDATLLGSRANMEFSVYDKRISDLLLTRALAPTNGFSTEVFNGGVMRTRGMELGLSLLPIQSSKVQWNARFNFFLSRSKILQLPVPPFRNSTRAKYGTLQIEQGKSPTQVIGWDTLANGTRVDSVMGDYNPDYKLSWANDVTVGKLKFYMLWDHMQGGWIHDYTQTLYDFSQNSRDYDVPTATGEKLGAFRTRMSNKCSACAWMQPMTYTKLREASFSLDLPNSFIHKLWSNARSMRLTLSGRNLLILTKYWGGDPEVLVRASTVFTQWRSDIWPYPPFRSYWFTVNVGF
jgi:TonB-linked SusC/RagA family outer membrane protein